MNERIQQKAIASLKLIHDEMPLTDEQLRALQMQMLIEVLYEMRDVIGDISTFVEVR